MHKEYIAFPASHGFICQSVYNNNEQSRKRENRKNYVCVYVKLFHVYKLIFSNNYKQISQVLFRKTEDDLKLAERPYPVTDRLFF